MSDMNVRVFCTLRPFNKREIELGADKALDLTIKGSGVAIADPSTGRKHDFPLIETYRVSALERCVESQLSMDHHRD